MRRISILLFASLVFLAACSRQEKPPAGRWIGNYESSSVMVDARLEILPDGAVRVSAPDMLDVGDASEEDRALIRNRLAEELETTWAKAPAKPMDFDGRVLRKPGGVAPQMEWNPQTREMKVVFYFGMQKSVRIKMQQVSDFSSDPWRTAN